MQSLDALPDASRLAEVFSAENLKVEGKEGMPIHFLLNNASNQVVSAIAALQMMQVISVEIFGKVEHQNQNSSAGGSISSGSDSYSDGSRKAGQANAESIMRIVRMDISNLANDVVTQLVGHMGLIMVALQEAANI